MVSTTHNPRHTRRIGFFRASRLRRRKDQLDRSLISLTTNSLQASTSFGHEYITDNDGANITLRRCLRMMWWYMQVIPQASGR